MANICTFQMKIIGSKKDMKKFCDDIKNHLCIYNKNDDTFSGHCNWSIDYNLNHIINASSDKHLKIEILSESTDDMLKEHIILNDGKIVKHKDYLFVKPDVMDYETNDDSYFKDLENYNRLLNMNFSI